MNPNNLTSLTVHLDNLDRVDGTVLVFVDDDRAKDFGELDQTILGSRWESCDNEFIYTVLDDYPKLVEDLAKEGYSLNLDNYSPNEG